MEDPDYYNFDSFIDANKEFEEYISKCKVKIKDMPEGNQLAISTMISVGQMAKNIKFKYIFERINLDDRLIFIEYGKKMRGIKENIKIKKSKNKKNITDKRKLGKGTPFSNLTFGIICVNPYHNHKKPINIKLFNNGKLHMAGCKSHNEIMENYEYIYKKIQEIDTILYFNDQKFNLNIGDFFSPKNYVYTIEMTNGTYKTNYELDLDELYKILNEEYYDRIFIDYEKSPLKCFLNDTATFSIYSSGSINIVTKSYDNIFTSYTFIKQLLKEHYRSVVKKELSFD